MSTIVFPSLCCVSAICADVVVRLDDSVDFCSIEK